MNPNDEDTRRRRCAELLAVMDMIERRRNWVEISRLLNLRNTVHIVQQCHEKDK